MLNRIREVRGHNLVCLSMFAGFGIPQLTAEFNATIQQIHLGLPLKVINGLDFHCRGCLPVRQETCTLQPLVEKDRKALIVVNNLTGRNLKPNDIFQYDLEMAWKIRVAYQKGIFKEVCGLCSPWRKTCIEMAAHAHVKLWPHAPSYDLSAILPVAYPSLIR